MAELVVTERHDASSLSSGASREAKAAEDDEEEEKKGVAGRLAVHLEGSLPAVDESFCRPLSQATGYSETIACPFPLPLPLPSALPLAASPVPSLSASPFPA